MFSRSYVVCNSPWGTVTTGVTRQPSHEVSFFWGDSNCQCHMEALLLGWMLTQSWEPENQEMMFAQLPSWFPQHFSHFQHRRKHSSGSELLSVFLLCWSADSWCPVWVINGTHGYGTIWILSDFHLSWGQAASATFAVSIFVLGKQRICLSLWHSHQMEL